MKSVSRADVVNFSLVFLFCACYGFVEWWAGHYAAGVAAARERHNFHRALVISGERAAAAVTGAPAAGGASSQAVDPTQYLSSAARQWLEGRPYVEKVHDWSVQTFDVSVGTHTLRGTRIYGVDSDSLRSFNLGKPDALESGDLVLARSSAAMLSKLPAGDATAKLAQPAEVLAQLPKEAVAQGLAAPVSLGLAGVTLAEPPALKPGVPVGYIHRDGDQIGGLIRPAPLFMLLIRDGYPLDDAQSEIGAYLETHEPPSSLGVQAKVRSIEAYFPPLVSAGQLSRWLIVVRVLLIVGLFGVGLGVCWLNLRRNAFEIALRRALGSTRGAAFAAVYLPWLAKVGSFALAGGLFAWLVTAVLDGELTAPIAMPVIAVASLGLVLATLGMALAALQRAPLRELANAQ